MLVNIVNKTDRYKMSAQLARGRVWTRTIKVPGLIPS